MLMGKVLTNRSYSRELECVKPFRGIYYIPSSGSTASGSSSSQPVQPKLWKPGLKEIPSQGEGGGWPSGGLRVFPTALYRRQREEGHHLTALCLSRRRLWKTNKAGTPSPTPSPAALGAVSFSFLPSILPSPAVPRWARAAPGRDVGTAGRDLPHRQEPGMMNGCWASILKSMLLLLLKHFKLTAP